MYYFHSDLIDLMSKGLLHAVPEPKTSSPKKKMLNKKPEKDRGYGSEKPKERVAKEEERLSPPLKSILRKNKGQEMSPLPDILDRAEDKSDSSKESSPLSQRILAAHIIT